MKKTIKCYLSYDTFRYSPGFRVSDMDMSTLDERIAINEFDVEVDIPDDFDPRPAQIKALQEKQSKAAAAFHAMNTEIMRQINELQALEMTA